MRSPAKFREYAEQCKQLAKRAANEKDRAALLEIAEAWLACAAEAERKSASTQSSQSQ
ncbi:MAG TPA: hypothetical protein VH678_13175 [Xanthobacteraceae bacterium]|jgi:hypothetical protein